MRLGCKSCNSRVNLMSFRIFSWAHVDGAEQSRQGKSLLRRRLLSLRRRAGAGHARKETTDHRWCHFSGIVLLTLIVTVLRFSIFGRNPFLLEIIREMYYLPLLLSAVMFGLKGTVFTYLLILFLFLPNFHVGWASVFGYELDRSFHIVLQGFIAILFGWFADREKGRRVEMERQQSLANIGQAATTIVHDLKNPLLVVKGFAQLIKEGRGTVRDSADEIIEAADTMQRIVASVLDFSKPLKLNLKNEDVGNIIARAAESCRAEAGAREVVISVEQETTPVMISADGFLLERAIVNVVANAVEASGKGQRVTIRTSAGRRSVAVTVTDQGSGISKEDSRKVFTPYFTTKGSGTGLGLAIVRKIIDGHRGGISLDSKPGLGTEVRIELPYTQPRGDGLW